MQGPSIIIKSSVAALMLHSVDGPLSLLPIHEHLGRLAQLNLSAVLSKQMRDTIQRLGLDWRLGVSCETVFHITSEQRCPLSQQDEGKRLWTKPNPKTMIRLQ